MTICIVGHGPSIVGRKLGEFIDSHDIVIRMAECDWQDPVDWGSKYDIGIYSQGPSIQWKNQTQRKPTGEYWFYNAKPVKLTDPDGWVTKIPIKTRKICRSVHKWRSHVKTHFSRGTAALLAAWNIYQESDPTFSLVGFDAVKNGFNDIHHPEALDKFTGRKPPKKGNTHDWNGEYKLIKTLQGTKVPINLL